MLNNEETREEIMKEQNLMEEVKADVSSEGVEEVPKTEEIISGTEEAETPLVSEEGVEEDDSNVETSEPEEPKSEEEKRVRARIYRYNFEKKYGFLLTETGETLFFSGHYLKKHQEDKIAMGAYVTCGIKNGKKGLVAKDIVFEKKDKDFLSGLVLPNGIYFRTFDLINFSIKNYLKHMQRTSGSKEDSDKIWKAFQESDYSLKNLDYLQVEFRDEEFYFVGETAPQIMQEVSDGVGDIYKLYDAMNQVFRTYGGEQGYTRVADFSDLFTKDEEEHASEQEETVIEPEEEVAETPKIEEEPGDSTMEVTEESNN